MSPRIAVRARSFSTAIDPSVVDENDPLAADASLDIYDSKNGFREPPECIELFDGDFLVTYRAAQRERVERIDRASRMPRHASGKRRHQLRGTSPKASRDPTSRSSVMSIARWRIRLTSIRTLDPSRRDYGSLSSERPDLMNYRRLGFART